MKIVPISEWFEEFESGPLFIAGPCSAESEEQVKSTASQMHGPAKPSLFRAGVWKPRTRPGTFNGVGIRALSWMANVKEEFGLRTAVETAIPAHIEACLKSGVDVLWIGARTASNPFSIDEIAEVLKGVDIPVLVKNPLNPDIDLWIGALERLNKVGITRLAAVHRGFSPFERTQYRNMPKWEIPIELRRRYRDLPVLCDPSHIAGDTRLVSEVAQRAMDLDMDGLMTEVHVNPAGALSDRGQQLSPQAYRVLIDNLLIRKRSVDDPGFRNQLVEMRDQVDSVDHQMIELIARRMELSDQIGGYKCKNNVAILQMERWLQILKTRTEHGETLGLDREFTEALLKILHQESIRRQTGIMTTMKRSGKCSADEGIGD